MILVLSNREVASPAALGFVIATPLPFSGALCHAGNHRFRVDGEDVDKHAIGMHKKRGEARCELPPF